MAEKIAEVSWLMGFITAVNTFKLKETGDITQGTDAQGMLAWITTYCRTHPLETVFDAASSLIIELGEKNGAH